MAQLEHTVAAAAEYWPAAHVPVVAPSPVAAQYVPDKQAAHAAAPEAA